MRPSRTALSAFVLVAFACTACGGYDEIVSPVDTTPGPQADIHVVVDDLGISHVYAQSDADAFFGGGYAMARDRLFQMELFRRRALGHLAELFGEDLYDEDVGARSIGFGALGEADFALLAEEHPEDAKLVEAWVAGVNRRILQVQRGQVPRPYGLGAAELDFVPEPWKPAHAFAIGKLLAFGLSNTLDTEILASLLLKLVPDTMAKLPLQMPAFDAFTMGPNPSPASGKLPGRPFDPASRRGPGAADGRAYGPPAALPARFELGPAMFAETGSNNWAVAGSLTDTGKPYLCGDPHQALTSPTRLWPLHLSSVEGGGTFDVVGFAFVGTPAVELGHNAHIGWTATTNFADAMDLLDVETDDVTATVGGESHPIVETTEKIVVRKDDGTSETRDLEVRRVEGLGLLLPEEILPAPKSFLAKGDLLFMWTGFEATREPSAYLALDRARDTDDFEAAADLLEVGAVNFVGADASSIAYHVHALVPDRGDPSSRPMPWHVVDGSDPANLWSRGYLPPPDMPRQRDPERGYIVTANNDPWGFTGDGTVENDPFYYGAFFDKGARAHRIEEALTGLIASGEKIGRADMETLQQDVKSPMAETVVPLLVEAVDHLADDPALAAWKDRADLVTLAHQLAAWDLTMDREKGEPAVLLGLVWFATKRALGDAIGPTLFGPITDRSPPYLVGTLRTILLDQFPAAGDFAPDGVRALLVASLDDTAAWLVERFGGTDPTTFKLGDLHAASFDTQFGGRLEVPAIPVSGSFDTISVSAASFFDNGKDPRHDTRSHEMSLFRIVIGFRDDGRPEATFDFARGTSENPDDPHFADQDEHWQKADHVPLAFSKSDVEARRSDEFVIEAKK